MTGFLSGMLYIASIVLCVRQAAERPMALLRSCFVNLFKLIGLRKKARMSRSADAVKSPCRGRLQRTERFRQGDVCGMTTSAAK